MCQTLFYGINFAIVEDTNRYRYLNLVEDDNMEVLQSIVGYTDYLKANNINEGAQKDVLGLLYDYCSHTEPNMPISEIDDSFFDEFLTYWLPKNQGRLKGQMVYEVLRGVGDYCVYIKNTYDIPRLRQYELMKKYKKECLRIYQLKELFSKYLGDPIVNLEPLIVDFEIYKIYKAKKHRKEKGGMYEQGLFEVLEIDYDHTVVLRKLSQQCYVRIILEDDLIIYIRKGDILHLRIKRKQFFSYWEIQELKGCYLSIAQQYIIN